MKLQGRSVSGGSASGVAKKVEDHISFLGDVDPSTGILHKDGADITDTVLVFPGGRGSTVGSYVVYQLKKSGHAPSAMVNRRTETIVATGAIISEIPLVDSVDIDLICHGDHVLVDGDNGTVELPGVERKAVVTVFLRRGDRILLVRRGDKVGSYPGLWSGISGHMEGSDPVKQAHEEVLEETGLSGVVVTRGKNLHVRDENIIWAITPVLMDVVTDEEVELNWENIEYKWVYPDEIRGMNTVPRLWDTYVAMM